MKYSMMTYTLMRQGGFTPADCVRVAAELKMEGIDWVTCSPKGQTVLESVDELKVLYEGSGTDLSIADVVRAREYRLQPLDTGDDMRNRMILRDTISYIIQHPRWSLSLQTHKLLGIK